MRYGRFFQSTHLRLLFRAFNTLTCGGKNLVQSSHGSGRFKYMALAEETEGEKPPWHAKIRNGAEIKLRPFRTKAFPWRRDASRVKALQFAACVGPVFNHNAAIFRGGPH